MTMYVYVKLPTDCKVLVVRRVSVAVGGAVPVVLGVVLQMISG